MKDLYNPLDLMCHLSSLMAFPRAFSCSAVVNITATTTTKYEKRQMGEFIILEVSHQYSIMGFCFTRRSN